jgi:hypothetical protein
MRVTLAVPFVLAVAPFTASAQAAGRTFSVVDTLPRFADVTASSADSVKLVAAANDALQGKFGLQAPMVVTSFHRVQSSVVISMRPDSTPGIEWAHLGGTVRVLPDGRRVIVHRF